MRDFEVARRVERLKRRLEKFGYALCVAPDGKGHAFGGYEMLDEYGGCWPGPRLSYRANLAAIEATWKPFEMDLKADEVRRMVWKD
jgi:hypothetical protein